MPSRPQAKVIFFNNKWYLKPIYKIFITLILLVAGKTVSAQNIYSVVYANQADIKVFVVNYKNQVGKNDGKWVFTKYENQAQFMIYLVEYENQADLKIFFVEY